MSIFPHPPQIPHKKQTLAAAFDEFRVGSDDQMVSAINAIAARFNPADPSATFGASILIVAPFVALSAPYTLPGKCPGVTIRSAGRLPIMPGGVDVDCLFKVAALLVTIEGLFAAFNGSKNFVTFVKAIDDVDGLGGPNHLHVVRNVIQADRLFVDDTTTAGAARAQIIGNQQPNHKNATHDAPIFINSLRCRVTDNDVPDGGGDAITVGARGGRASIKGNDGGGADITTTASLGHSAISANTSVGAVNALGTDDTSGGNPS